MAICNRFSLRLFRPAGTGRCCGEALFDLPSGADRRVAVYRDGLIYFGPAGGDEDLFTGGGLEREVQAALRAALAESHPELLVEDAP